ncbi:PREDICTED: snake venom vascular endothelial growth factor toxin ICPP-like [Dinoponera quadriceps]|uniref:Snake venom vascular endothelial growth factor toxin ICPP-like n=1 Tax=Dinoponera quadriceps TaxID=609295 RepID=A0A6P3YE50_DINQU|nr:PREDICTED: snake venom vascular endothelial growth factor toxin ICPP-like [Dinoponera quadriceps]
MERGLTRRSFLRLLLLVLTAIGQTSPAPTHSDHRPLETKRTHLHTVLEATKNFICKKSQPRAYSLMDLMQHLPSESARRPVYIVLKRCDSYAGCCNSPDLSCAPVESSIYYEEMEIVMSSLKTNSSRRTWIRVRQHGECSCELSTGQKEPEPSIEIL